MMQQSEDHRDYERLIGPIEDQMIRAVWRVTQNAEDAEEAFQEALAQIWRRWDRVRRHPNPHALVLRMCINAACDLVRRKVRRRRREAQADVLVESRLSQPDEAAQAHEQESAVLGAIARLSHNQAAAVVMRVLHGHSYDEIGEALGCKDVTARKHVMRGREQLRRMLSPLLPGMGKESSS